MCARARLRFIFLRELFTGTVRALYGHCAGCGVITILRQRRRRSIPTTTSTKPFWIKACTASLTSFSWNPHTQKHTHTHTRTCAHITTHTRPQRGHAHARARTHTQTAHRHECHPIVFGTSLFVCQLTTLWGTGEGKKIATFFKMSSALTYNSQHPSPPIQC